jgi:ubiquinone/menaquinone biosynthesis C-methylase UbiE
MSEKSLSQQRFAQYAQEYVRSQDHAKGVDLDLLVELAQPDPGSIVLDIATGGGHTALRFAPLVKRVIASDLTPQMLTAARQYIERQGVTNVFFSLAEAEHLPFRTGSFELVTCRIAPHHFRDVPRFVGEATRALKPGGLLLVQDHMLPEDNAAAEYLETFERLRDPSHRRAYTENEWLRTFEDAGLVVGHSERIEKRHAFSSWVERQGCPPRIVARLEAMLREAPPAAANWMRPLDVGMPSVNFANQHILIAGRKKRAP